MLGSFMDENHVRIQLVLAFLKLFSFNLFLFSILEKFRNDQELSVGQEPRGAFERDSLEKLPPEESSRG